MKLFLLTLICISSLIVHSLMVVVMSWNVRGIISSTLCLSSLLDSVDCDIVVLSEHKLKSDFTTYLDSIHKDFFSFVKIDNALQENFHTSSTHQFIGRGGVAFMIKNHCNFVCKKLKVFFQIVL